MVGKTKFIIVAGGVISGVGKGVTTASIGKIVKEYGFTTTLIKIDPYINYDAGTLRPTEHGEVWVTEDGGEIDQDLGTYERFIDQTIPKKNNITTGQVYKSVIERERSGGYLGQTVQLIPHITDEIIKRIRDAAQGYEIAIIEIGGTAGDYENIPYLFALKAMERELGSSSVAYVLVTYLPSPSHIDEMKTKPTQQAVRLLSEQGILPDFIVCRSKQRMDEVRKHKIEVFAHIKADHIIAAPDVDLVYHIPLLFEEQGFGSKLLSRLDLKPKKQPDWSLWKTQLNALRNPTKKVHLAIIGKYLNSGEHTLQDSYLSIYQALLHASAASGCGLTISWLDAQEYTDQAACQKLELFDGIIIPGGFGASGVEGKINCIAYARTHNIPFLGLCYGMQLAVVEFARNVVGWRDAHTSEVNQHTTHPVVTLLDEQKEVVSNQRYGGTMRLGGYPARLKPESRVAQLYHSDTITERHRHRYEINPLYVEQLERAGLLFSGSFSREDGIPLMEFIELSQHPFFVATQAHPEFNSRFGSAHPLFTGFLKACSSKSRI